MNHFMITLWITTLALRRSAKQVFFFGNFQVTSSNLLSIAVFLRYVRNILTVEYNHVLGQAWWCWHNWDTFVSTHYTSCHWGLLCCALNTVLYTLNTVLYTLNTVLYKLNTVLDTLHTVLYTLSTVLTTLHTVLYTLNTVLYTLHTIHCILHTAHSMITTVHKKMQTVL